MEPRTDTARGRGIGRSTDAEKNRNLERSTDTERKGMERSTDNDWKKCIERSTDTEQMLRLEPCYNEKGVRTEGENMKRETDRAVFSNNNSKTTWMHDG